MSKTHWKKAFNKEYLGAHDLEEGGDLKLTIKQVLSKPVKDPQGVDKECNVAFFNQDVKPMILNVGACKLIKRFSGSNFIEGWKGVSIQVYVLENVRAFGELTDALRIRDRQPQMEKESLTPTHTKWKSAVEKYKTDQDLTIVEKYFKLTPANKKKLIEDAA